MDGEKLLLGVYRIEGDALTICNRNGDGVPPADFVGRQVPGSRCTREANGNLTARSRPSLHPTA